jgi:hypothetical protein
MGVAAVATLVLLSGCETAVRTDYAKKLEGTWTNGPSAAMIAIPVAPGAMPTQLPVMRTVTAEVTRDGVNEGTFSITVSDLVDAPANVGLLAQPLVSKASGTFTVDASEITVTIPENGIELPLGQTLPDQLKALLAAPQVLGWELANDDSELRLSGAALLGLQITASPTEKYLLTKQTSGS